MDFLSELRYPTTRLGKAISTLLALLLFGLVSVSMVSGFLLYQILRPARTSTTFDLDVMMGHPTEFSFSGVNDASREGWFFPGLRGAPTVIVCHGYQSQRAEVLTLVSSLQEHGYNVFVFDFPGHGSSPGFTTLGYRETGDLRSALQALSARGDVDPRHFGLWGVDMGGYAALETAASDNRVAAFAVDDAYDDPREMAQIQVTRSGLTVLPSVGRFCDFGFRMLNRSFRNTPPVSKRLATTAGVPKLFIRSDDRYELSVETLKLFLRAPDPKQMVDDRISYSDMSDDDRKNYENLIVNFFLQNLPPIPR